MNKPTEYEFERSDGSKFYEFVDPDAGYSVMTQIRMFTEMHGAKSARPVERNKPMTFTANGNWGVLYCEIETGLVMHYERGGEWEKPGDGYDNITRLDADEWRRFYPGENITLGHDILDFGSWDTDGRYVGPETDWREEYAKMRAEP